MAEFDFEYNCETQTPEFELTLSEEEEFMDIKQEFNPSKFIKMPVKKFQCCAFCKNHNKICPKKGHSCLYRNCPCKLCDLTRKAQKAMRHQQRLWRHQKNRLKDCIDDPSFKIDSGTIDSKYRLKCQVCDKCRNHNHLTKKKHHLCPYVVCNCELCSLTFTRREIMKQQQRVRRSKITAKLIVEPSSPGSTSRDGCGSPLLPALWSENLIDFNYLTSIMIKNKDIKDADIDAQRSFYSSEDFDMANTTTKTEYSIDEPVEDDIVYLKTVTNSSTANILDASLENRLSPPPLIPLSSSSDIMDEELHDSSKITLQNDEASSHFNTSDDKSNIQHFQLYTEAHDSNSSYNEIQLSPINIKNIMSFNGANAHLFLESLNKYSNCTLCSPFKKSEYECHTYCLCPKSIIQQCIQMFKDTQNKISSDFLYKC